MQSVSASIGSGVGHLKLTLDRLLSCFLFLQGLKLYQSQSPMHTIAKLLQEQPIMKIVLQHHL